MAQYINYKMPRARTESEFIVYPWTQGDTRFNLQSDNHCIIVDTATGKAFVSKRFAQYPRFEACSPANGGKVIDTPKEILEQLAAFAPTGETVTLVG